MSTPSDFVLPEPGSLDPADDLDLDELFQKAIIGVTGLDGTLVRPRFQVNPPPIPDPTVDWAAVSVPTETPDASPVIAPTPGSDDTMDFIDHEQMEVQASFYGPNSRRVLKRFRHGILIPQNMDQLKAVEIYYQDAGPNTYLNELLNQQYYKRADFTLYFRRKVTRQYGIGRYAFVNFHLFDDGSSAQKIDRTGTTPVVKPGT